MEENRNKPEEKKDLPDRMKHHSLDGAVSFCARRQRNEPRADQKRAKIIADAADAVEYR
jgi:hypothetical protein